MPRFNELLDYLSNAEGDEAKHGYLVDVPPNDWCSDIYIDLHGSFVQLRKVKDKWTAATDLPVIREIATTKIVKKSK